MSVLVHLYYGEVIHNHLAKEGTTLKELLQLSNISENTVLFTGTPESYKTPLVNLNKRLKDYNMWFLDKSYVAEITVYNKTDIYDKELYEFYLETTKELE